MEPGDIVVGKPVVYTDHSDGIKAYVIPGRNKGALYDSEIEAFSHKEAYLLASVVGARTILSQNPEYAKFERTRLNHKKVKGMIVDFDPMGSKRPHIEGLAAVLIEDKVWWIVAGDLQVVKLGRGN